MSTKLTRYEKVLERTARQGLAPEPQILIHETALAPTFLRSRQEWKFLKFCEVSLDVQMDNSSIITILDAGFTARGTCTVANEHFLGFSIGIRQSRRGDGA